MSVQTFEMIGIAVLVIAVVTIRQCRWQPVNMSRLIRMPLVFGVIGVVELITGLSHVGSGLHVRGLDVAIIGGELTLGLLAGWLMGRLTRIRRIEGVLKFRLAGPGIGVWLGFIVVRIGLAGLAHVLNAELAEQSGTVLIVVAVIKTIQALMVRDRIERHATEERRREQIPVGI